ncbi:hypothetical protein A2311_01845 [candidate division WOR-1 bacterium RIFOXYB2_FULL_48_7]|uniref:Uncharacterized protein n=1 Tax=candidate division WOR-1 bacterium RIFOXYB2_FULL_48_7 TaxID=1802583 RepID=A0A1F4TD64_UNCSA|nr:MAG: hypothetical protein A2311_01845 [candidate division WOR-1 bacterium RIFOXYB2_FULL_48_7]
MHVTNAQANLLGACQMKQPDRALKYLGILEKARRFVDSVTMATNYGMVARICMGDGRCLPALQLAIRGYNLNADAATREHTEQTLLGLTEMMLRHQPTRDKLTKPLADFLRRSLHPNIPVMSPQQAKYWHTVVNVVDQNDFYTEQKMLIEKYLDGMAPGIERAEAANRYLEVCWKTGLLLAEASELGRIADSARILLAEGETIIRDRLSEDSFFDLIVTLEFYDLFEALERAVAMRRREPTGALKYYLELARGLRHDLAATYEGIHNSSERYRGFSIGQVVDIKYIQAKIVRCYLEGHLREQATAREAKSRLEILLLKPWSVDPALKRELIAHLKLVLKLFEQPLMSVEPFWYYLRNPEGSSFAAREAYVVHQPGTNQLAVYLGSREEGNWVRVIIPTRRVEGRWQAVADPQVLFQETQSEPWVTTAMQATSYLANAARKGDKPPERSMVEQTRRVLAETSRAAGRLFMAENGLLGRQIFGQVAGNQEIQERRLELHNRLLLARTIFETYLKRVEEAEYQLEADDLLYPYIVGVNFLGRDFASTFLAQIALGELLPGQSGKYPFMVALHPRAGGQPLIAIAHSPKKIVIPGHGALSEQEAEYLFDLIYEAAVKLAVKSAVDSLQQTGYLFQPPDDDEAGLGKLRQIYAQFFHQQLTSGGLMALPWFTFEPMGDGDGLYRPINDQSPQAKEALAREGKTDEIYVQVEPAGLITLLPVRIKKIAGTNTLAPWERQPLRERQQALLNDPRVLPIYYGIYILTWFSDGRAHAFRYLLKPTEAEIMADELLADVDQKMRTGFFRDPKVFLRGTARKVRAPIESGLAAGTLTIDRQEEQTFALNTTFKRPRMVRLSTLLAEGYTL